eukprot:380372-Rhodomonas_salina.8
MRGGARARYGMASPSSSFPFARAIRLHANRQRKRIGPAAQHARTLPHVCPERGRAEEQWI